MILTTEQAQALEEMKSFVAAPQENIFILKGYAGTGKTTLLSVLLDYLDSQRISYDLMAPTGRAAKVMRDKLKRGASTIHSRIYKYVVAIKVKDAQKDTYHRLYYTVDEARYGSVIIVDEGSMVSIKKQLDEIYVMGSGSLLEDILTYAGVQSHRAKIIFVGDPAQLPPVGENEPVALQRETFESRGLRVMESWLREVVRQASGSLILANATQMRRFIEEGHGVVMPEYDDHSFQRVEALDLLSCYFRLFPKNNLDNGPIITYSNRSCLELNQAIRERYFPNHPNVTGGDKLLVVKNNQFHNLVNGDFVEVVWASPRTESHTISLKEENVTLTFRDLQIKTDEGTYQVKILDDLLSSPQANITSSESKALFNLDEQFRGPKKVFVITDYNPIKKIYVFTAIDRERGHFISSQQLKVGGVYQGFYESPKKPGGFVRMEALEALEGTAYPQLVRRISGTLHLHPKGFGFINNDFVSPALVRQEQLVDGQTYDALSVLSYERKKDAFKFAIVRILRD